MKPDRDAKAIAVALAGQVHDNEDARCVETLAEQLVSTALLTARQEGRAEAFEEAEQIALANAHADCEVAEAIALAIRKAGEV